MTEKARTRFWGKCFGSLCCRANPRYQLKPAVSRRQVQRTVFALEGQAASRGAAAKNGDHEISAREVEGTGRFSLGRSSSSRRKKVWDGAEK